MADPYSDDPWATDAPAPAPEPDNIPDYRNAPYDDAPAADPWGPVMSAAANLPADEAQTSTPNTPNTKENNVNNGASEGKVVTTIKYGSGFDAPWTVIHSDSVEEAKATLNEAKDLFELTAKVAKYAKTLDSGTAPAAPRGNGGGQARQASTPPGVESKSCAHGEMVYRTGNSAKGPWAGYFCPLEKGNPDQCKAVFVRNK
jgi:hypothetical protein